MRNYSRKMKKSYKRRASTRLRGGNQLARFFGFGRKPALTPEAAQAQLVQSAQDNEVAGLKQTIESKEQQASDLRKQCDNYQNRADELDKEIAQYKRNIEEIARNRESKNKCDQEHADQLKKIEQKFQQRLSEFTERNNQDMAQENTVAQEEHTNCVKKGMGLSNTLISSAQKKQQDKEAMNNATASYVPFKPPLISVGGRKSRRRGRKSHRGRAHCYPKSKKKCPYYKKYGHHK